MGATFDVPMDTPLDEALTHHGIKGQKWGVRRFQNEDGSLTAAGRARYLKDIEKASSKGLRLASLREAHTIPKGTVIYRTTAVPNEDQSGVKYISYTQADRNHYNAGWIRQTGNTGEAYENAYVLNQDLKVPSRDELKSVVNDIVLNDPKTMRDTVRTCMDMLMPEGSWAREAVTINAYTGEEISFDKVVSDRLKGFMNEPVDDIFITSALTFGKNTSLRGKVIDELKKRGYNAMTDEASVGGHMVGREGIDPIIMFDGNAMTKTGVRKIDAKEEQKSLKKYESWQRNVALSKNKKREGSAEWSDEFDSPYLMHHGIKGQKWGVRRYQNEDGSLTLAGKARYLTGTAASKISDFRAAHAERKKARDEKRKEDLIAKADPNKIRKNIEELSDEDLRKAIARIELSQRVNELSAKSKTFRVVGGVSNFLDNVSKVSTSFANAGEALNRVKKLFADNDSDDGSSAEEKAAREGRLEGIKKAAKDLASDKYTEQHGPKKDPGNTNTQKTVASETNTKVSENKKSQKLSGTSSSSEKLAGVVKAFQSSSGSSEKPQTHTQKLNSLIASLQDRSAVPAATQKSTGLTRGQFLNKRISELPDSDKSQIDDYLDKLSRRKKLSEIRTSSLISSAKFNRRPNFED